MVLYESRILMLLPLDVGNGILMSICACCGGNGVIQRFCCWNVALLLKPADCRGKVTLTTDCLLDMEFFLELAAPILSGDCVSIRVSALFTDSGGELRAVPLLTWQVGHSFTNLEISSFGTLHVKVNISLFSNSIRNAYQE